MTAIHKSLLDAAGPVIASSRRRAIAFSLGAARGVAQLRQNILDALGDQKVDPQRCRQKFHGRACASTSDSSGSQ